MSAYFYWQSEPGLWTVGYEDATGRKHPDSDWDRREDARTRTAELNGGGVISRYPDPYKANQIETMTDPGAYGYKVKFVSGATGDGTPWMNISKAELSNILKMWKE